MTTNFDTGVSNLTAGSALGSMIQLDPTTMHVYFKEFDTYAAGDFTITATGAATEALANEDGGVLLLTNTAGNGDLVALQNKSSSFTFVAGKQAYFKARVKVSDAVKSSLVVGLQNITATPFAATDGIYFLKPAAAATVNFTEIASSVATTATAVATMANATYMTFAFYYDGKSYVNYYASTDSVNPTFLGRIGVTTLPSALLTVSFALTNGEAVAKTMSVDYIFASKER